MADHLGYTPGVGATVATDEVGGRHYQRVKLMIGPDGVADDASEATPLPVTASTAAKTKLTTIAVASSVSSVEIIGSHPSRKGLMISNISESKLYLSFVAPATPTNAFLELAAGGALIFDQQLIFTDAIYGLWDSVDGTAQVTQFV
jgi:hypothetical protein